MGWVAASERRTLMVRLTGKILAPQAFSRRHQSRKHPGRGRGIVCANTTRTFLNVQGSKHMRPRCRAYEKPVYAGKPPSTAPLHRGALFCAIATHT